MKPVTVKLSKNNRLPFSIFVLAFVAYFSLWAYINQRPSMQPNWAMWRGSLVVGSLFLVGVFFMARSKLFTINAILIALVIPLVLGLTGLMGFTFIYWRLPQPGANDVAALFLFEGLFVICGGLAFAFYFSLNGRV